MFELPKTVPLSHMFNFLELSSFYRLKWADQLANYFRFWTVHSPIFSTCGLLKSTFRPAILKERYIILYLISHISKYKSIESIEPIKESILTKTLNIYMYI